MKECRHVRPRSERSSLRPVAYALLSSLVLGFASAPVAGQAAAEEKSSEIDAIFGFATPDTPGCAVGVSEHGEVIVNRTFGLADVERGVPSSTDSVFDIGSTHKQFVAAAVLLLVEDGRLALGDDIREHLPELPEYDHTVTVDHLLTHTSGIRDWTVLLPLAEEGVGVLELILRQSGLDFVPGEEWRYSNSGYVLLKEIVARVSGMSFAEFSRTRLFEPLGMTSSAYVADILHATGERALAYRRQGAGWEPFMRLGNRRGGGTVVSNAADLLTWNDALTDGRLGEYVTAKLEEPTTLNNGRTLTYARGLHVDSIPGGRMVWHDGGADGYGTWLGRFTDHDLSLAVMCNFEPVSVGELVTRVADLFLPTVDPEARPPGPTAAPGVDVAGREGLYFAERTGEPLRLANQNGTLTIPGRTPLVPVSEDRFRPPRASLWYRSQDAFELTFGSSDVVEVTSMEGETTRYRRAEPWTPVAADRRGLEGRYHSEDLGQAFEILPATNGVLFRVEGSPDQAIQLETVAPDTYMHLPSTATVRFERDADGTVTGLAYSNPALRNLRFRRLGDRRENSRSAPAPEGTSTSAAAPMPRPGRLVGEYELMPGRTITITLEDGELHGEPTDDPKRPLVHVSGATFAVGEVDAPTTVTFTLDADGSATAMMMRRNGSEITLPRVR